MLGVAYDTFAGLKLLANFRIRIRNWNRIRIRIRIKHEAHIRLPRPSFTPSLGKQRSSTSPSPFLIPSPLHPLQNIKFFFVPLYLCIYENVANI